MVIHDVRVSASKNTLSRPQQLAWKIAEVAADPAPIGSSVTDMVINRIIDNAAVATAAINRHPVASARAQALAHPREGGATVFGLAPDQRFCAEWAAWANGTAVRELDMHDTFLAADYSHPGDNIPAILAVAQQCGRSGEDLVRGIVAAYEIQINLVKAICLHERKIDHIAHLGPAVAAGLGALLGLDVEVTYQAIQQALHTCVSTRQSRKGEISSWKAYAPAHAGKLAIEAVDRAMRGEGAPSPIYEGEDSVIARVLAGPDAHYRVPLPGQGEEKTAILESYTKEHSAEYQAQALIDLAFKLAPEVEKRGGTKAVERIVIHTSHHTHHVIGTGSNDPQKFDPKASRETLDHSIMYIFAVALEDGRWHHVDSYTPARASRPDTVALWRRIETREDESWTRRYHSPDAGEKAFGGRVEITFAGSETLVDELAAANAHSLGVKPFGRDDYVAKFETLTEGLIETVESQRFLNAVQRLPELRSDEFAQINVAVPADDLISNRRDQRGIF